MASRRRRMPAEGGGGETDDYASCVVLCCARGCEGREAVGEEADERGCQAGQSEGGGKARVSEASGSGAVQALHPLLLPAAASELLQSASDRVTRRFDSILGLAEGPCRREPAGFPAPPNRSSGTPVLFRTPTH